MAITIDWASKVINIPQADMTPLGGGVYELDLNSFRLALKDLEDSEDGMAFLDTHTHNTEVTFSGLTLSRVIQIINGYTITFEDGQYAVNAVGANSNLADVVNLNQVSLRSFNSAGLQVVTSGSGLSQEEHDTLISIPVDISTIPVEIADEVIEGSMTLRQIMRLLLAVMAGRSSGGGTETIVFRDLQDSKDRVIATVDASGNRSDMTLDAS